MGPVRAEDLERLRDVLAKHEVEYLFLGKMAAILQGYPDTTQDADLFVEKTAENGKRLTQALRELGFSIGEVEEADIRRGRDFIQLKNGPFDLDLVYAPDGIERYEDARLRGREIDGFPVCSIEDVIESKARSNRDKDRESLPRLRDFATYLEREPPPGVRPLPPKRSQLQRGGNSSVPAPPQRPAAPGKAEPGSPRQDGSQPVGKGKRSADGGGGGASEAAGRNTVDLQMHDGVAGAGPSRGERSADS